MKLRSIELEAFRAYKDTQRFELITEAGDTANLVVIYAPNGFGKTSLFDAVEWALTGKINRISSNNIVKNAVGANGEQGLILKNTYSPKKIGRVKLVDEFGDVFEVCTKESGKRRRKTDYFTGEVIVNDSKAFKVLPQTEFVNTHMLTHEKIDTFLMFNTPEQRYTTLVNFWDSNNDTTRYLTITEMYKLSEKRKQAKIEEIALVERELLEFKVVDSQWNTLIEQFNKLEYERKLPEWVNPNSKNQIDEYHALCVSIRVNLDQQFQNLQKIRNQLFHLVTDYPILDRTQQQLRDNELSIVQLKDADSRFVKLEKAQKTYSETAQQIAPIDIKLSELYEIKKGLIVYSEERTKIQTYTDRNYLLLKEITDLQQKAGDIELTTTDLLEKIKQKEISVGKLAEVEPQVASAVFSYQTYFSQRPKLIRRAEKMRRIQSKINSTLRELESERGRSLSVLSYTSQQIFELILNDKSDRALADRCQIVHQNLTDSKQQLQRLVDRRAELVQLGDKVDVLIKLGRDVISSSKSSVCPLCNASHKNYEAMLNQIDSQMTDVLELSEMQTRIDEHQSRVKFFELQLQEIVDKFREFLKLESKTVSDQIVRLEGQFTRCKQLITSNEEDLEQCERTLQQSVNFLVLLGLVQGLDDGTLIVDSYRTVLKEKIRRATEELDHLRSQADEYDQVLISITKDISRRQVTVKIGEAKIRELRSNPTFMKMDNLLEKANIPFESADLDEVVEELLSSTLKVKRELETQIGTQGDIIIRLKNQIGDTERFTNLQLLNDLESKRSEYILEIQRFKDITIEVFGSDRQVNDLSQLQFELQKFDGLLRNLQETQRLLTLILEHVETQGLELQRLEKKLNKEKLVEELETLSKVSDELRTANEICQQFIVDKINQAFNVDTINEIYQKIDPHPDLKVIKFVPSFSNDMRPQIDVFGLEGPGQMMIQPVLYFSSAQLDILSLSIFLARALNDNQKPLETIFMDDPVHHLDSINVLSFIDMLRTLTGDLNKQIVISTHNENLFKLLRRKIDPRYYNSTFIEIESYGTVKSNNN